MSFRLLTEYHSFLLKNKHNPLALASGHGFPSPYGVSFILISCLNLILKDLRRSSFRLLTEYHSFL